MIRVLTADILALMSAFAGTYYLFFSRAAKNLAGIENQRLNARRQSLRRANGLMMVLLSIAIYAGFHLVDDRRPRAFLTLWIGVLALLFALIVLAMMDLRLTARLRHATNSAAGPTSRGGT